MFRLLFAFFTCVMLACSHDVPLSGVPPSIELIVSDESVSRLEVSKIFGGYGPTRVFYHFTDQDAVLLIRIDRDSSMIRHTGTINIFSPDEDVNSISNWIKYQYEDWTFGEAPTPNLSYPIPNDKISTDSVEFVEHLKGNFGSEYDSYRIGFHIDELTVDAYTVFVLKEFSNECIVYQRTK